MDTSPSAAAFGLVGIALAIVGVLIAVGARSIAQESARGNALLPRWAGRTLWVSYYRSRWGLWGTRAVGVAYVAMGLALLFIGLLKSALGR